MQDLYQLLTTLYTYNTSLLKAKLSHHTYWQHDSAIVFDLGEELVCVEQLS